jgi:hypothetical protein
VWNVQEASFRLQISMNCAKTVSTSFRRKKTPRPSISHLLDISDFLRHFGGICRGSWTGLRDWVSRSGGMGFRNYFVWVSSRALVGHLDSCIWLMGSLVAGSWPELLAVAE